MYNKNINVFILEILYDTLAYSFERSALQGNFSPWHTHFPRPLFSTPCFLQITLVCWEHSTFPVVFQPPPLCCPLPCPLTVFLISLSHLSLPLLPSPVLCVPPPCVAVSLSLSVSLSAPRTSPAPYSLYYGSGAPTSDPSPKTFLLLPMLCL